ncbi:hypothetical protein D6U17_18040 [Lactiplantibacillus pentosus]|uniref:Uncharacterized protein n=1 Tax=Lactiplantibacillus pentosus TaxID=1589 RepID=A0AB37RC00_LACPE|nr:hypothetical protein D6U20_09685 [Lactiplantibacillus pentosus]RMW49502.1 hypothetical protein D6U19_01775 [Lactiplantibacillus pentosus]RMW50986.1 hypothetical protein D6U17_18040 [Lactiplantibacillus pentosus]RMW51100.1 hypothetical protein D6U21_16230 [Lactiplantibacillus pentosus]
MDRQLYLSIQAPRQVTREAFGISHGKMQHLRVMIHTDKVPLLKVLITLKMLYSTSVIFMTLKNLMVIS